MNYISLRNIISYVVKIFQMNGFLKYSKVLRLNISDGIFSQVN